MNRWKICRACGTPDLTVSWRTTAHAPLCVTCNLDHERTTPTQDAPAPSFDAFVRLSPAAVRAMAQANA